MAEVVVQVLVVMVASRVAGEVASEAKAEEALMVQADAAVVENRVAELAAARGQGAVVVAGAANMGRGEEDTEVDQGRVAFVVVAEMAQG